MWELNRLDYGSGGNPKGFKSSDFCGSPGYDYFIKDYKVLEAKDHSFDVIHCRNVIHHIPEADLPLLFNEFNRLLKEDGLLIISEPIEEFHEQNKLLDIIWYRWINVNHDIMVPDKYVDYKKYIDKFNTLSSYRDLNNEIITFQKETISKQEFVYEEIAV